MTAKRALIVIPCLNEAAHIGGLIEQLEPVTAKLRARIVVADGGSSDGSPSIVQRIAVRNNRVSLTYNPKRLQSAGVNLAVEQFGADMDYLIRIDAHGGYPDDYCERLIEEAEETGADSVVVAMRTTGSGLLQKAAAAAQNSKLRHGRIASPPRIARRMGRPRPPCADADRRFPGCGRI